MAKTEKELQDLKEKVEALDRELKELTEEELSRVAGGIMNGSSEDHFKYNPIRTTIV